MNSLEYVLVAPKSTNSTCRVMGFQRKLVQLGSVCIVRNSKSSLRHNSMMRAEIYRTVNNERNDTEYKNIRHSYHLQ